MKERRSGQIDIVDGKMVFITPELEQARAESRERVKRLSSPAKEGEVFYTRPDWRELK